MGYTWDIFDIIDKWKINLGYLFLKRDKYWDNNKKGNTISRFQKGIFINCHVLNLHVSSTFLQLQVSQTFSQLLMRIRRKSCSGELDRFKNLSKSATWTRSSTHHTSWFPQGVPDGAVELLRRHPERQGSEWPGKTDVASISASQPGPPCTQRRRWSTCPVNSPLLDPPVPAGEAAPSPPGADAGAGGQAQALARAPRARKSNVKSVVLDEPSAQLC